MLHRPVAALAAFALLLNAAAAVASDQVYATAEGAIRGYDPVAYFTQGRAVAGAIGIQHEWNGAIWRFASVANRDAFAREPERYAPQYGGYCAYGTASGYKVSISPEAFAIRDGKLYLNFNAAVQRMWNEDPDGYIVRADGNGQSLRGKPYISDTESTSDR